jgi:hypothetical protein
MEATLKELLKPGELNAIALFNGEGDVVASVGDRLTCNQKAWPKCGTLGRTHGHSDESRGPGYESDSGPRDYEFDSGGAAL